MTRLRARLGERSERGASAVEFGLILIPMLYLIFGGIAFAYMFSFRQGLSQSASEGSRAAIGGYSPTAGICPEGGPFTAAACPAQFAASQAVANSLSNYDQSCTKGNLTCTFTVGASTTTATTALNKTNAAVVSGCQTLHVCISVKVTYPYREHSLLPSVPGLGFVLPRNLTFTSVVELI